ncbi:MAG: hypothetical protein LPJ89_10110 [Hymenobacteraceae bacterium]|nr:hypothetical protein [Hymenobacteraceae bacterium]
MQKLFFSVVIILGISLPAAAQKYRTAAGVRISRQSFGLTLQQKLWEKTTLEAIGAVKSNEVSATTLLEYHRPLLGKRFNYYLGGGAHIGHLKDNGTFYGADAILGVEYKLNFFPILVSADVKPAFHINHTDWFNFGGAISARYVILKEKPKKKKWWHFGNKDNND